MVDAALCVGVVLAGGKSTRMGVEKAALRIGGETLLARIVGRVGLALPQVVVIGPPHLQTLVPHVQVIPDDAPGLGPLGGLNTALGRLTTPRVFVVACDMPFLAPALVRAMAQYAERQQDVDVVALRTARGLEPLHAIYARSCLSLVRATLAGDGDHSLAALINRLRVMAVPADIVAHADPRGLSSFNANSPEEWEQALAICAAEGADPSPVE